MSQGNQPANQLLSALSSVLSEVARPAQVLKTILGQAVAQTGADRGIFATVSRSGKLSYRVLYKIQKEILAGQAGRFSRNVFAHVLETGRSVRVANAMEDPRYRSKESIQDLKLTSVLCMPIKLESKIAAMIHLESNNTGHFTEQHETLLGTLLSLAAPTLGALELGEYAIRERDEARSELEETREILSKEWSFNRFVGQSTVVRELEERVNRASQTEFPVLLLGETGTGKSIVARVIHHAGPRSKGPFITLFCPSLQRTMVETELFGHKRGAFTGADSDRIGKVQAAEKGTLFLDEIGELPVDVQPKLLRLLQEKTFDRVGDPTEREADVRVIAATNRDLEEEVRAGTFRRDLYERLNYLPLKIPPLRERSSDVPELLMHCLKQFDAGRWIELSDETSEFLSTLDFAWPGNVRHLEQLAARLAMEQPNGEVRPADIKKLLDTSSGSDPNLGSQLDLEMGLPQILAEEEKKWLKEALSRHQDLTREALAAKLKISPAALYKKLRMYGIN